MSAVDFKAKAHIFKNTAFMLKCSFKSAPVATILIYLAYIAENVYYAVVFNGNTSVALYGLLLVATSASTEGST